RQQHIECSPRRHDSRKPLSTATARNQAQAGFRKRKNRVGGGESNIASQSKLQPATHAITLDCSDDRLGNSVERLDPARTLHPLAHLQRGFFTATFLNVGASAKSTLAFTADDNDPHLRVVVEQLKRLRNTLTDAVVDRVDLARAGQYDPADRDAPLYPD